MVFKWGELIEMLIVTSCHKSNPDTVHPAADGTVFYAGCSFLN